MVNGLKNVSWQTVEGEPIALGEQSVTLQARVLQLRWTGGGYVWNQPTGITAHRAGSSEFRKIENRTRRIVLLIWAVTGAVLCALTIAGRHR